jgi:RNA polymerase sigma-70 factor (ECF subfamily)
MTDEEMVPPPVGSTSSQSGLSRDPVHALICRMARGDEPALASLYDVCVDRVFAIGLWFLRDADEAEDVVEETFWQAWRSAREYNPRRSAGTTWILMIARSRALDRLRSRRRRVEWTAAPTTVETLFEQSEAAKGEGPDTAPEVSELRLAIVTAMGALPQEQREAVEMAFFGGLSHAEIAETTGQPLGTVKTRIRLAMQKLRERLVSLRGDDR